MLQIVTDSGADLSEKQKEGLPIHIAPLRIVLGDERFDEDNSITHEEFYEKLSVSPDYPTTSQASTGDFAEIYRKIAATGDKILSIHISSGLSGTLNSAKLAAEMVPEADVTFWDSKTLSAGLGWQVQAAALASQKGWTIEKILERLEKIRDQVNGMFTLKELRYLVHGGRISHIKGLMAQVLNIKPIIEVEHERGIYVTAGQAVTFKRAINQLIELNLNCFGSTEQLRAQIVHGLCPDGVEYMKQKAMEKFNVFFEEVIPVAPVLGAHTGATLTGLIIGPLSLFTDLL